MSARSNIIETLKLLASEEKQLAYERNVPHVDITAELVCMWFDDQCQPGTGFDADFSTDELAALARFHEFYDQRIDRLPESDGTVRTWLADPFWREIMQQAQATLDVIAEPDAASTGRPVRHSKNPNDPGGRDSVS